MNGDTRRLRGRFNDANKLFTWRIASRHNAHTDQPIVANVLTDMAAQGDAATWLAFLFFAILGREKEVEAEHARPADVCAGFALTR
jgi:hypothetical protein